MRSGRKLSQAADDEFMAFVLGSQLRLRRVAYLMCGDWHRAEDIVQTALTKVYVGWSRIRAEAGPDSYARRAVVNAAIDERRRPWRREHAMHRLPDGPAVTEERMDDVIVESLRALSPRQRAVVVLRYVEDLDVTQTAHLLGITPGTVKSQAAKGLATLRERLSMTGIDVSHGGAR